MDSRVLEDGQVLNAAMDVGERLLKCGGEVSRVEDTIQRICRSCGAERTDVFAITSCIVVTMHRGKDIITQTRRINGTETDFNQMETLNELSRHICRDGLDICLLQAEFQETDEEKKRSKAFCMSGNIIAAGACAVFFGGSIVDGVCAAVCGILIFFLNQKMQNIWNSRLIYMLFCSFCAGMGGLIMNMCGLCQNVDKVMIGDIMLLIPGIALTNSIRDFFAGDTISGLLRLLEALIQAAAIACGFALAIYVGGNSI